MFLTVIGFIGGGTGMVPLIYLIETLVKMMKNEGYSQNEGVTLSAADFDFTSSSGVLLPASVTTPRM